jgi:hypothetical protein
MGRTSFAVAVAWILLATTGPARAEMYAVEVRRIDQDLYKTDEGVYIQTRYCYRYAYGDEAVLKYEQYAYDNKLIFDDGEVCEVVKVFK